MQNSYIYPIVFKAKCIKLPDVMNIDLEFQQHLKDCNFKDFVKVGQTYNVIGIEKIDGGYFYLLEEIQPQNLPPIVFSEKCFDTTYNGVRSYVRSFSIKINGDKIESFEEEIKGHRAEHNG